MRILIVDNYDSFTYNLVQLVEEIIKEKVDVIKNDLIILDKIKYYDAIILSAGPGIPLEAKLLIEIIQKYAHSIPILGVCLGHQAIIEAFGGSLKQLKKVCHGVETTLKLHKVNPLYKGLKQPIIVGRYHSWVINEKELPIDFEVTSTDHKGLIMSFVHKKYPITGIQYHPESILTPYGKNILKNWIKSIQ